jgi:protein SCO1/2
MRKHGWLAGSSLFALSLCLVLAIVGSKRADADNSRWGANYFPNVTLTTHEGKTVKFYDDLIRGKIVAIDLIYTTCKYACPLETARLAQVQTLLGDRMGKDVFFYSITIDPEHDTPAVLKEYAEKFHAGPGWTFLTGKAADIELISKKLGLYSDPNPANKDGHTPALLVGNEETGQWMRNSALDNPKFLARTIGDWLNSWKTAKRGVSFAEAPAKLTLDPGRYGFTTHCAPCHSIGGGQRVGPDLAGVTKTRDRDWLAHFIVAPATMVANGDPTAVALFEKYKPLQMPNLALTAKDAEAIIGYLEAESASGDAGAPAATSAPTAAAAPASANAVPPLPPADFKAILAAYLDVQQSLSADSLAAVGPSARSIASRLPRVDSAEAILSPAIVLERSSDLASARTAFGRLGDALLVSIKASNMPLTDGVQVAYCPMAKKYWLQKGAEVRNPFYGQSMLDCGRIVAGIPDVK